LSIFPKSRVGFSFRPTANLEAKNVRSGGELFHIYKEMGILFLAAILIEPDSYSCVTSSLRATTLYLHS
jgi:hypothetical protein